MKKLCPACEAALHTHCRAKRLSNRQPCGCAECRVVILDAEEAERRADEGQQRAYQHASEEEKVQIYKAIREVARFNPQVNSDLVWDHLGWIPRHGLASALGPLLKKAAGEGLIARGGVLESARPTQHRRVIRDWDSLIYAEKKVVVRRRK